MSNADLVRSLFDDFNRGDFEAAFAKIEGDVDWGEPPDMPDTGGAYRGHEGLVAGFGRFMGAWESISVDLEEVVERAGRVVVQTHWRGRSKGTGIEVDQRVAQVYELRDGKVTRVRQFRTLDEALAAP
jgi:ketosteroid isomerase-like protein